MSASQKYILISLILGAIGLAVFITWAAVSIILSGSLAANGPWLIAVLLFAGSAGSALKAWREQLREPDHADH